MIDEPVETASPSLAKPNSRDVHRTRSSPRRESVTAHCAAAYTQSDTKSRDDTEARLFSDGCPSPSVSARAVRERFTGYETPVAAPDPSGWPEPQPAMEADSTRVRSFASISTYARSTCPRRTGCARWRCVYAGRIASP